MVIGEIVHLKGYPKLIGMIISTKKNEKGDIWSVRIDLEAKEDQPMIIKAYSGCFELLQRLYPIKREGNVGTSH